MRYCISLLTLAVITTLIACTDTASTTPEPPISAEVTIAPATPTSSEITPVVEITANPTSPPTTAVATVLATPTPFSATAVPVIPITPTPCEVTLTPPGRTPVPDWFGAPTPTAYPATGIGDGPRSSCRANDGGETVLRWGEPGIDLIETRFAEHFVKWTADGSRIIFGYDGAIWSVESIGSKPRIVVDANPGYRPHGYPALPYGLHADVSIKGCRIVYSTCQFITEHPLFSQFRFELLGRLDLYDPVVFHYEIATARIDGTDLQRLTDNEWIDHFPTWSPDGSRIAFIAETQGGRECFDSNQLYTMNADGSDVRLLTPTYQIIRVTLTPPQWSPNGRRLAFIMDEDGGEGDCRLRQRGLYTVKADRTEFKRLGTIFSRHSVPVSTPAWSPDGNRIAFLGKEDPGVGIYTVRFDGTGLEPIYAALPNQLSWSPDGAHLLFVSNGVWVANADGSARHKISLSEGKVAWSPDGSRIAVYIPYSLSYSEATERGEFPYSDGDFGNLGQLYTMNRDGTDIKVLLE